MNALLSIGWEPELRGLLTVIIGFVALCGSVYLLLATNVGVRLGLLVALAGLFGWMASMGAIWWSYGIGLKGREPSWKPAEPFAIVLDSKRLLDADALDTPIVVDSSAPSTEVADTTRDALVANGWKKLPEDDRGRGQAIAAADEIVQVEAKLYSAGDYVATAVYLRGGDRWPKISNEVDFTAFFHKPKHAIVEIVPVVPQRAEPGRAPARPVIDESQPHQYVLMIRDLGSKRQPAAFITIGSTILFLLCCWMLHRRDKIVAVHTGAVVPAKA